MEGILSDLTLKGVLNEFYSICEIPHGSHNEKNISNYLFRRLESLGLSPVTDSNLNICCDIPAAPGHENAPLTVLQAHMDMVCAKAEGTSYDPLTHPICHRVENGVLCTDGASSLGADNGIGIAAVLHLISENKLDSCGPLRVIFTTCEEKGMIGALEMSPDWLEGAEYLINLDGFVLMDILICSAGSADGIIKRDISFSQSKKDRALSLSLCGFPGGHSGYNAADGRGNPIVLLGRFLSLLLETVDFEISCIEGGSAPNAIPCSCTAQLVIDDADYDEFTRICREFDAEIKAQYQNGAPDAHLDINDILMPEKVWDESMRNSLLDLFLVLFNGVESYNPYFPSIVGSSSNLGEIHTLDTGVLDIRTKARYLFRHSLNYLVSCKRTATKLCGFTFDIAIDPSHIGNPESKLVTLAQQAFQDVLNIAPNVTGTHVGVEPSVFHKMKPELDIITIGTDIFNAHSPRESTSLDSTLNFTNILHRLLKLIAE